MNSRGMMAEQAARKSQEETDSSLQTQAGAVSGSPQAGDRRVTADSFRQLLARLKKSTDAAVEAAPAVTFPVVETPPPPEILEISPSYPAQKVEQAVAPASASAPAPAPAPAAPPPERQRHLDKLEQEKRERARADVHAASLEIISRLRKAANASQKAVEGFVEAAVAKIADEPAAPQEPPQQQPVAEAPIESVEATTAPAAAFVEDQAQPTAAQFEEQELTAGLVAEAQLSEPVAEMPVEQPVAVAPPVEVAVEEGPVAATKQRRRHPFFPDVFVDDDGHPLETAAQASETIAEQVVESTPIYDAPLVLEAEIPPPAPEVEYTEQSLLAAATQLLAEQAPVEPAAELALELPVEPTNEVFAEQPVQDLVEELLAVVEQPVAEAPPAPAHIEVEIAPPEAAPVAEPAPAQVAVEAAAAEQPTVEPEAETETGHRDDLVEDEADAVKHLHGVEVKGIGDIARAIFSAPTPAERAAFLQEIAELNAAAASEAGPREVLAAAPETLVTAPPKVRKVAPADDPFAKISPDVSTHVNNDGPDEDSGELARSLLDMMLSGPHAGLPQERALAADALLKLIPKVPTKALVAIAERVSLMEQPPHLLIARLINDPRIEISGPLLEQCNHISDQVLGKVIATGQVNLQRLIARRRHLSPAITDMLVEFDDASVILTLVRNGGATFSHGAFNRLVEHASHNEATLAPLSTRADLPAHVAFELFWLVPAQLRRYLLSRFLTDSETLTKILKITKVMQGVSAEGDGSGFANKADVEAFMEALISGQREEAETKLATIAAITPECAARIVGDQQGEPLAIIFKAIGLNRAQFEGCMTRLQQPEIGIVEPGRQILELLSIFNSMSFNKARILLTYWDWAVQKHGPYASAV